MARVLIVDDDAEFCTVMRQALEMSGHEAVSANSTAGAIETLHSRPFDVAMLDVLMPGGGAISLVHKLRGLFPSVRTMVITGSSAVFDSPIMRDGLRYADVSIAKTVSLDEINAHIDRLSEGSAPAM